MPIRVDLRTAQARDVPALQGLNDDKAEKKFLELQSGAALRDQYPPMPNSRGCQDALWAVLFLLLGTVILGTGFMKSAGIVEAVGHHKDHATDKIDLPPSRVLVTCIGGATVGSIAGSFVTIWATERFPKCMVWTSLIFGPTLSIAIGLGMMANGMAIPGLILVAMGGLSLFCVFFCYRSLIPFTIKMAEVVASIIKHHNCMFSVALLGALMSLVWTVICSVAFTGMAFENQELLQRAKTSHYVKYAIVFICGFCFTWGAQVASNVCHVAYCYVFGSWYYGQEGGNPLGDGVRVATTKSLGSVCMGSFLVAVIRALERVASAMQKDAEEGGNTVGCVLACILQCVIGCIGDILEYFNDWAYVQCAVRGVSFWTAAKITYSMCTCANVQFIISDLLLDSLVGCGGLFCGILGAAAGGVTGYVLDSKVAAMWGAGMGFPIGLLSGVATLTIINSGVKTILACWADDPAKLQESHPEISNEFDRRIYGKLGGDQGGQSPFSARPRGRHPLGFGARR